MRKTVITIYKAFKLSIIGGNVNEKLVLVLTMLLAFACSSLAFAADGGDLNKEQKTAEKMMTSLEADAAASYAALAPTLSADLNKALGEKNFAAIQSQVKNNSVL